MKDKQAFHGSDLEKIEKIYGIESKDIVNFAANVNPLGISFRLRQTLADHIDAISSYPDREYTSLRRRIADYVHTNPERILVGNGCTELISLFIQITRPAKALLIVPTYSEYEREISLNDGICEHFPLTEGDTFTLDLPRLASALEKNVDLLILCNPNNPTSSLVTRKELREILSLCRRHGVTLLTDETYMEFTPDPDQSTAIPLTDEYDNLIVLRGVSKFFSAPGLRLGYAICGNPDLLAEINRRKNPWAINSLAAIAGEIMFSDAEYIETTRNLIHRERTRICALLARQKDFRVFPPQANFLLLKSLNPDVTSRYLFEYALSSGLMIRDCSDFPRLDKSYIRFCFMGSEEDDRLLDALGHAVKS